MKKLFFTLPVYLLCIFNAQAQGNLKFPKHEIYASISPVPMQSVLPENTPQFNRLNVSLNFENEDYSEIFTVGYMISLSKNMSVGLSYSKCKMESDLWLNAAALRTATVSAKYNIWMLDARYKWFNWRALSLYSHVGVGAVTMKVDEPEYDDVSSIGSITGWDDKTEIAWHVTPLGIQYTFFNHISLFVEGGIGLKSCFSGGMRVLF